MYMISLCVITRWISGELFDAAGLRSAGPREVLEIEKSGAYQGVMLSLDCYLEADSVASPDEGWADATDRA